MTTRDVARRRLATQHLTVPALRTPGEVVSLLGAAQSQEFALATWSIAQRAPGLTPRDVHRAYDAGELLRTHVLRPTWHFVTPADLGLLLALTGPRVHQVNGHMYRSTGLDAALLARTDRIITDTLADGRHRTRAELAEALAAAGVEASSVRLAYVVMHAELEGLVCSGVMRGRQHTYALLAERAPDTRWPADRDEALAELAVRYFTGHGPATARDLVWWSGLTRADVLRGVELAGEALRREEVDGRVYWCGAGRGAPDPGPVAHLLQPYDEYVVGYAAGEDGSRRALDVAGVVDREPRFHCVLLVGGQLAGFWRRTVSRRLITVEVDLMRPLTAAERAAVDAAVAGFGAAHGLDATWD